MMHTTPALDQRDGSMPPAQRDDSMPPPHDDSMLLPPLRDDSMPPPLRDDNKGTMEPESPAGHAIPGMVLMLVHDRCANTVTSHEPKP